MPGPKNTVEPEPETWFAPAGRATPEQLAADIATVGANPVTDVILRAFGGILLVLNKQRQAVAVNKRLLASLGITDIDSVLGLRQGEILHCIHADDAPDGCGTGRYCANCGAAIAIVASAATHTSVERECRLTTCAAGQEESFEFRVRATPLVVDESDFTVITLQNISAAKRFESLYQVFCHDLNNVVCGLQGSCELLKDHNLTDPDGLVAGIQRLAGMLAAETAGQRDLFLMEAGDYEPEIGTVTEVDIWHDLRCVFDNSDHVRGCQLELPAGRPDRRLQTSRQLLLRVLVNMTKNALEASSEGGTVRLGLKAEDLDLEFWCWNEGQMPDEVALQVFQRFFTTRKTPGRGLGTYSMKLIGERYLQGKVSFTSDADGTVFRLRLPSKIQKNRG